MREKEFPGKPEAFGENHKKSLIILSSAIVLVALQFAGYAYTLPNQDISESNSVMNVTVSPYSHFYGLQKGYEDFKLATSYSERRSVDLNLYYAERRLAETAMLHRTGAGERASRVSGEYLKYLENVKGIIESTENDRTREYVRQDLEKVLKKHSEFISDSDLRDTGYGGKIAAG